MITMHPAVLRANLTAAIRAVSQDETRAMNALRIDVLGDEIQFTATCGHWIWINRAKRIGRARG